MTTTLWVIVMVLVAVLAVLAVHAGKVRRPRRSRVAFHPWERHRTQRAAIARSAQRALRAWVAGHEESKAQYRHGMFVGPVLVHEAPTPVLNGALWTTADNRCSVEVGQYVDGTGGPWVSPVEGEGARGARFVLVRLSLPGGRPIDRHLTDREAAQLHETLGKYLGGKQLEIVKTTNPTTGKGRWLRWPGDG